MIRFIHRIFRLDTITSRLLFWVIALICVIGFLNVITFMVADKEKRIVDAKMHLEYALNNQKVIIENWQMERARDILYLANLPASQDLHFEQMAETFQTFIGNDKQLESIVFLDDSGRVILDTAAEDIFVNSDLSLKDRDYFIAAKEGKEHIQDVVVSRSSGIPVIIFSAPVMSVHEEFQGVVFGAAYLSELNELLSESIQGESGKILLLNQEGYILSHLSAQGEDSEYQALETKVDTKMTQNFFNEGKDLLAYTNHDGDKVLSSVEPIDEGRYFLVNEINENEVLRPHYQMLWVQLGISLVIILIGVLLIIPVSKYVLRPIVLFMRAISRMRTGNYQTQLAPDLFRSSPVELRKIMEVFNEMSREIHEHYQTLQELSRTDELTGIFNRRVLEEYLHREWLHARREQKPVSIAFVDIDDFKDFNDTYGHQAGDDCLQKISQVFKDLLHRPRDFIVRYGGEEFVMLLPETDSEGATYVAEKARSQVEALQIPHSGSRLHRHVTISVGVASLIPKDSLKPEFLIRLADQALYEAKSLGKNRVITKVEEENSD